MQAQAANGESNHSVPGAIAELREKAAAGDAQAQNQLGLAYRLGDGVDKDPQEALRWFLRAAKQKNPSAAFNVATAYYNGEGVPISDVGALAWFLYADELGSKAAKEGAERTSKEIGVRLPEAEVELAAMYEQGELLPKDEAEAAKWYRAAAETGDPVSQTKLGSLYVNGRGVPKDASQAFDWFTKAAKQNFAPAMFSLGYLCDTATGTGMNAPQAAVWYEKAALAGHPPAMLNLAVMTAAGRGVSKDPARAYGLFRLAEIEGMPQATTGRMELEGKLNPEARADGMKSVVNWWNKGRKAGLILRVTDELKPVDPAVFAALHPEAFRVGNGVKAPVMIFAPDPDYSEEGRKRKLSGSVSLLAVVGVDGNISDARISKSLEPSLDSNALEALRRWRFRPAEREGVPVPVIMNIEMNFRLFSIASSPIKEK